MSLHITRQIFRNDRFPFRIRIKSLHSEDDMLSTLDFEISRKMLFLVEEVEFEIALAQFLYIVASQDKLLRWLCYARVAEIACIIVFEFVVEHMWSRHSSIMLFLDIGVQGSSCS